ncbi:MAG: type II secretion system protein GspN [Deltaproteobacteria bacterium]|nr:type II secretion system protein GspN [Deltaproteobacteria bacterium]
MKTKKWIAYTIYGVLITAIFLYVRFPSDSAGRYIKSIVEGDNPNVVLLLDSVKPCLLPGIRLGNIEIGFRDKPDLILRMSALKLRPAIIGLFTGKLTLLLNADAYEGHIKADIGFTNRLSRKGPVRINAGFNDINLGKCSCIKTATGREIGGIFEGTMSYNGERDRFINGTGSANIALLDGRVQLLGDIFGLNEMNFDKMEADMTLKNRTLKINNLKMAGRQLSGSFNGDISLNKNIMQSRLAIKGDVEVHAIGKKVSTTLKGTVANPVPRFK